MLKRLLIGVIARIINIFIPVKKKHWAFGSDQGNMYREGPKYMIEYMLANHPDYTCTFFTQNKSVYEELNSKGIPSLMNLSLKGIIEICRCEAVFTSQTFADIRYTYRKKNRKFYYLLHGMPLKRAADQLPDSYAVKLIEGDSLLMRMKDKISYYLTLGYKWDDIEFLSSCSEFLSTFLRLEHKNTPVVELGMPRNDALFQPERMKNEKWIDDLDDKFVITYMPTHRGYGTGDVSPSPFENRPDIQQWMRDNNVVLLVKNHPNMIEKLKDKKDTGVIKDITKLRLDPQVCIYHSDVLITDYSSVWMDYLLLRRPILFYIYDDFETNDVGTYYDVKEMNVGHFCYSEDELFELIMKCKSDPLLMIATDDAVSKYHKYNDGNSCERYFNEINKTLHEAKG